MLKDEFDCTFFTQSPSEYQRREAASVCELVSLPDDDTKFDIFLACLSGEETVVLDNYYFSSDYQKAIKDRGCKLVCIDDVHNRFFYADAVINHCIDDSSVYNAALSTRFFLGAKWALLRRPFRNAGRRTKIAGSWLISFGGSDPYNLTCKYVGYLLANRIAESVNVMVGDGFAYYDALVRVPHVHVHKNLSPEEVAGLMSHTENVVCSASSVCYEALSQGCRVYAGYYVDNQRDFYETLSRKGLISPLGDLLAREPSLEICAEAKGILGVSDIERHYKLVFRALNFRAVNYVDMTLDESKRTWQARNDSRIRRWMTHPEPFSFESHQAFVENLKSRRDRFYCSFFDGERFLGSIDYINIVDNESAERGLFVDPDCQGRGIAEMMELFCEGDIVKRGVKVLKAEALKVNEKSVRFHEKMGYQVEREDGSYYYFRKSI